MSLTLAPPTPDLLTPSEVVLLRPVDFVPGFQMNKSDRKHTRWFDAIWIAATGAVVASGQVRLTIEPRKRLFGLLTRQVLRAERAALGDEWPAGSLEAAFLARLDQRPMDLETLYAAVLGGRSQLLSAVGMLVARAGLLRRGLMEQREVKEKHLLGWTSKAIASVASPAAEALASVADVVALRRLIDQGGGADPAAWALVPTAWKRAVNACTIPEPTYDRT